MIRNSLSLTTLALHRPRPWPRLALPQAASEPRFDHRDERRLSQRAAVEALGLEAAERHLFGQRQVAVQMTGETRLGIFDLNGEGEVVGGIVVMRSGENADKVINAVKVKMNEVEKGLPDGITFKADYDRSTLIEEAIASVKGTLIEELITVSIIVIIFLFNWRSAIIILIQLPISVAAGFIFLEMFGISSNIMSLTGIALAIGVVVDDGIVMVENAYRHISEAQIEKSKSPDKTVT